MALYDLNPRHDPDDTDPPDGDKGDDGADDGGDDGDASDAGSPGDLEEPMRVVAVPVSVPHPGTSRVPVAAEISRDPRSRFRPMSDPRVAQVAILGSDGRRLLHLRPPFPEPIERMVAETYGVGKYRIVQRDDQGKHIGSRTVTVAGEPGQTITYATSGEIAAPPRPSSNGHAVPPSPPASPAAVSTAAPAIPAGMDWRTALITTGIPLLAGVISAGFQAVAHRPEQKSELSTLTEVAKLLQVPNTERAEIFREGVKLYKTLAEEARPERSEGGGELNIREILQGIGEMVSAFRGSQPPRDAGNAVAAPGSPAPASAPAQISAAAASDQAVGQNYVETLLLTEIHRAVGRADSPECLVVLIESYLPPLVVTWLESAPIESVLEELPKRFPKHTEYLKEEQVQAFLRSAITMLREDAAAAATGEEGADVPPAGVVAATS